jgi:SAM-dependent methyltransferase
VIVAQSKHYDDLLAEHYSWTLGSPFEEEVAEQTEILRSFGAADGPCGAAFDLGCGPGFQAAAIADLGFRRVVAVETSRILLSECVRCAKRDPWRRYAPTLRTFLSWQNRGQSMQLSAWATPERVSPRTSHRG